MKKKDYIYNNKTYLFQIISAIIKKNRFDLAERGSFDRKQPFINIFHIGLAMIKTWIFNSTPKFIFELDYRCMNSDHKKRSNRIEEIVWFINMDGREPKWDHYPEEGVKQWN